MPYLKTLCTFLSICLLFNQVFADVLQRPPVDDKTLHYLSDALNKAVVNLLNQLEDHKVNDKLSNATLAGRSAPSAEGMNFIQAVEKMNQTLPQFFEQFSKFSGLPAKTDLGMYYDPTFLIITGVVAGVAMAEGYRNLPIIIRATSDHLIETRKTLGEAVDRVVSNNPRLTSYDRKKVPKLEMDKMYMAENMVYPEIPEKFKLTAWGGEGPGIWRKVI